MLLKQLSDTESSGGQALLHHSFFASFRGHCKSHVSFGTYCLSDFLTMVSTPRLEEGSGDKLARKARESPFMPIGIAGLATVCGIGAYKYKTRGAMSTSVFLMQLRVAAQGTVVAALTLGLAYTMANEYLFKKKDDK